MYNKEGTPTLTNVTFADNAAGSIGGMCNDESSPTLTEESCGSFGDADMIK